MTTFAQQHYVLSISDNNDKTQKPKEFQLTEKSQLIGRANNCEIQLQDTRLSRAHAQIEVTKNQVYISSLNNQQGIQIGDTNITEKHPLNVGETVTIGSFSATLVALDTPSKENGLGTINIDSVDDRELSPIVKDSQSEEEIDIHDEQTMFFAGLPTKEKTRILDITEDNGNHTRHVIIESELSIGRGLDNTIALKDLTVSRKHLVINRVKDEYTVKVAPKSSGTLHVNSKKTNQAIINPGDFIQIGKTDIHFLDGEDNKIEKKISHREPTLHSISEQPKTKQSPSSYIVIILLVIGLATFFVLDPLHILSPAYQAQLKSANKLLKNKKYHAATKKLNGILDKYPDIEATTRQKISSQLAVAEFHYGKTLWQTGQTEKALKLFQNTLEHCKSSINSQDLLLTTENQLINIFSQHIESQLSKKQYKEAKQFIEWIESHMTVAKTHPKYKKTLNQWNQYKEVKKRLIEINHNIQNNNLLSSFQLIKNCQQQFPTATLCYLKVTEASQHFNTHIKNELQQIDVQQQASIETLNSLLSATQQAITLIPDQNMKNMEQQITEKINEHKKIHSNDNIELFESESFDINEFKR
ncbi:MAG: FHA domain-containing protein [Methylococcales bacterium]|jgi:pSer/pThr/pTyr-binding forkhead associated (FHA) protein/tetratricopeptide (TPR) repeat protein|nr:FHA domain-containing protein [Methylococcales bacterium]MBT7410933.1 FHA domain-containing protein [Methylococcales bacterium]